jgi:hypothetical protein
MTMNEIRRFVLFHKLQKPLKSTMRWSPLIVDAQGRCMSYQDVNVASVFNLVQGHPGNHLGDFPLHLRFGVQILSLPVKKSTSQTPDEKSFKHDYFFVNTLAALGISFLGRTSPLQLIIVISMDIIERDTQAADQVFQVIWGEITTSKDKVDVPAFLSEKMFLEKRFFDFVADRKNSHEFQYDTIPNYINIFARFLLSTIIFFDVFVNQFLSVKLFMTFPLLSR